MGKGRDIRSEEEGVGHACTYSLHINSSTSSASAQTSEANVTFSTLKPEWAISQSHFLQRDIQPSGNNRSLVASDGCNGLFAHRIPYRIRPCRVPNPFKTNSKYTFNIRSRYLDQIYEKDVRCSDWFKQGWVFQERMLAPCLLTFTRSQVLWDCSELQAAETWPCGKTSKNHIDRFVSVTVEKARLSDVVDKQRGIIKSHTAWWTFLQHYVTAELTVSSDRLPAI